MLYNVILSNLYLMLAAVASKVVINLFHPSLQELLLSGDGLYAVLWGLRMDFAIVALLATLCLFYDLVYCAFRDKNTFSGKLPLALAACWLVVTTTTDYMYFSESGRHITFEVFTSSGSEISLFVTGVLQYTTEFLLGLALTVALLVFLYRLHFRAIYPVGKLKPIVAFLLIWPLIAVSGSRGGWHDAPQDPMSTYKISSDQLAELAWSAPYSITYYLVKGPKKAAKKITPDITNGQMAEMAARFSMSEPTDLSQLKPYNVIVVLLESWAALDMHSYAGGVDATPFFDSLRQKSLTTKATYANGYRTVEGMFAAFCSFLNPVGGGVAGTQLQNNSYRCLPKILKEQGWQTHFIQGSGKGSVGAFAQSMGFDFSYGKTDFPFDAQRNYWGYMDESIYRFSIDKLAELKSPYLVTINTGTTHDRFVPGDNYQFGNADNDWERASVLFHADQELEQFVSELGRTITEPTLVVLMSDHTAGITQTGLAKNAIPMLMFALNADLPVKNLDMVSSQRDVGVTILDWLGGSVSWFTGHSLLDSDYQGEAYYSQGETVSHIIGSSVVQLNARTGQLSTCYEITGNVVTAIAKACTSAQEQQYQQARDFVLYSQQLLFDDRVLEFGVVD